MPNENELSGVSEHKRPPRPSPTTIGNHKLQPSTLMMGYGFDPELSEGSLKPPIFLTSTFVFENAAAGKQFFEGVTGKRPGGAEGLIYSRFNGPNQEILEDRLSIWEEADDALAFSSGMSAIATLLLTFVRPGDCVVHSGPLYAATETLIAKILGQFGVHWVDFPSGATREEIDKAIAAGKHKGRVSLIYLESPANPTNQLVDVEAVRAARDASFEIDQRPPIAIDNTFLGPLWAKPLSQWSRPFGLQSHQICRWSQRSRRWRSRREPEADRPGAFDAQHDRHHLRSEHGLDAPSQPRNARASNAESRRKC